MAFVTLVVMLLAAQVVLGMQISNFGDDPNVMKKHVGYFDRNQDGIIHVTETIEGMKALGLGTVESTAFATAIHTALSAKTRPGLPSDNSFPIITENIALAKHTSDSGAYAADGSFVPEIFESIFTNHAHIRPDGLNSTEVDELLKANRVPGDFKNWLAAEAEWKLLYKLGKEADGFLSKVDVRNIYDGSFFYQLAQNISSGTA